MILRLILGDQLNENISSLRDVNKLTDNILICEVKSEATYVKHHKKKIAFLFSAMRHFSKFLEESNFKLKYVKYDDVNNSGSLFGEVKKAIDINNYKKIIVTKPNEFRLYSEILEWENKLNIHVEIRDDNVSYVQLMSLLMGKRSQTVTDGIFLSRNAKEIFRFNGR